MAKDPITIASICMERSLHTQLKTRAAEAERSISAEVRFALRRHLQTDNGGNLPVAAAVKNPAELGPNHEAA